MPRIGGAFPLPISQLVEGGSVFSLPSGGTFYPPSGEYICVTDAQSNVQYWDPQQQQWRTFIPVSSGGYFYADGYNFRIINTTGIATSTGITAGSGMTNGIGATATGVSASVAASNTTGYPTITGYIIVGGAVQAPTITQAGSGFLVPPLIVIDPPPPGGIQAQAHCVLTAAGGSGIASITVDNAGAGYTASPNFWVIPQTAVYQGGTSGNAAAGAIPPAGLVYPTNAVPGNQNTSSTGAQLTSAALINSGHITGFVVINSGGGYTSASPTVTLTGAAGGGAASVTVGTTTLAVATVYLQPRVQ